MKISVLALAAFLSAAPVYGGSLRNLKADEFNSVPLILTPAPSPLSGEFFETVNPPPLNQNAFAFPGNNGEVQFTYLTAEELVTNYLKDPAGLVQFRNIDSSSHQCFALFKNGHSAGVHNVTGEYLIPDSGVMLSSGNVEDFNGQDSDETTTDFKVRTGDADLETQLPSDAGSVFDPCYIQFEFRCPEETDIFTPNVNFDYVFGSEEYYEYVFSDYNDGFGFFLNGDNIALVPDSDTPVTINNVNYKLNAEYFIGNELEGRDENIRVAPYMKIEADGFTTELTATATPQEGWNKIKLVIGDVADGILDSWVLLEAGTFSCVKRTTSPSISPSVSPVTALPTNQPVTPAPTSIPTMQPSTKSPTNNPTSSPSASPSKAPSDKPSDSPSLNPTPFPSKVPTDNPTPAPTESPSGSPIEPTESPSYSPTERLNLVQITSSPTPKPTPCRHPSHSPTDLHFLITPEPSTSPTTMDPSSSPSNKPTEAPVTPVPTSEPTSMPSDSPSWPYSCGILPCDRSKALRELYSTISDPSLFDDPTTPQSLALDWITNHDSMTVCPQDDSCHAIQRYVLAVFYFSTEGWQWSSCKAPRNYMCEDEIAAADANCDRTVTPHFASDRVGIFQTSAWLTPIHECHWGGVACRGEDEPELAYCLDQIDIENNNLRGVIPEEIAALENLRYLYLEQGQMSGTIPVFLGSLRELQVIDLDFNNFSGSIPNEIYGLANLRQLDLNDNKLSGTVSADIGHLTELYVLQLDHNNFSGDIPSEIGQLEHLEVGFFSYNDFKGTVSSEICALRTPVGNLEKLQVDCSADESDAKVDCKCCSSCRQPDESGERKLIIDN
eukprot:g127.t1 g127   contig1:303470-306620(-)